MFKLSATYTNIYADLLKSVGSNSNIEPEVQTAFWPVRGHHFDGDLFVIGRFTNGWHDDWLKSDMVSESLRPQIIERIRSHSEVEQKCALDWVVNTPYDLGYNPNMSAFWRVIKKISLEGVQDSQRVANWPTWICWSNLYKIAPQKPKGETTTPEPKKRSKDTQFPFSVRLIQQELEEFCPRRVLVLAGASWFRPFAKELGLEVKWNQGYAEGVAGASNRKWVIAQHPMTKPEAPFVDEVLQAFES